MGGSNAHRRGRVSTYEEGMITRLQSAYRRYASHRLQLKRKRQLTHRLHIVREIVETEETYVRGLRLIVQVYFEPLKWKSQMAKKSGTAALLEEAETRTLFSNISAILECNAQLLADFQQRLADLNAFTQIGDIMANFAPFLKVYTIYYSNYETSSALLDTLRRDRPALEDFFEV